MTRAAAVADLAVIGGGLVGLATAAAAAERGLSITILTRARPGAASRAAAGLLVPHYGGEGADRRVTLFMSAARDLYRSYARWAEARSGLSVPFLASGALELARSPAECAVLHDAAPGDAVRLTARDVADLEPALAATAGGLLHPKDGAVDNVRLMDALVSIVEGHPAVQVLDELAVRVDLDSVPPTVAAASGARVSARRIVLAAGAWTSAIHGIPRPLPVRPVRGQLCTIPAAPLRHVVLASHVYMVTRGGDRTLVGSTMEEVGFEPGTTPAAIGGLRGAAVALCPALDGHPVLEAWSGLRPATPDLLPILGADPDRPALVYACGHSRNGILLAPITAAAVATIVADEDPPWDIAPFSIQRFGRPAALG